MPDSSWAKRQLGVDASGARRQLGVEASCHESQLMTEGSTGCDASPTMRRAITDAFLDLDKASGVTPRQECPLCSLLDTVCGEEDALKRSM